MTDYAVQMMAQVGAPPGTAVVERHGRSFTATYAPRTKNSPPYLNLTTNVDEANEGAGGSAYREDARPRVEVRPAVVLRAENGLDRLGKRLGVNREMQTGDQDFDARVYVESDAPDQDVERTLADERVRRAARALLDGGAMRIELHPLGLTATQVITGQSLGEAEIERIMARLNEMVAALPLFTAGRAQKRYSPGVIEAVAVISLGSVAAPLLFAVADTRQIHSGSALLMGLGGGLALWALVVLGIARLVRGRSGGLRRLISYGIATLLVIPTGAYAALVRENHDRDDSPAVDHATTIRRVFTTRSKSSVYYHIEVASWHPEEATVTLDVASWFADKAFAGNKIVVTTHAGKFGWEWVERYRLVP